ncbi:unnamed protein product [Eruca vesicaria subsp. sativa]|uniref:Oleosin n=1 Tax=Eruca vesicaria subsp. sativa TaxID=29727 RepID=A0ABC8LX71_ERUVS|nr:unnamed protein product [Eruca vesicaria subsp. sativa]
MKEEIQNELAQTESQREGRMFSFLIPVFEVIKVVMASVSSIVFLGLACVTLAGTAVALVVSTPLFIIFSPILVPATIATTLLATGLGAGTTLGVTALGLLMRLIKHPGGAEALAAQPSFFLSLLEMPNFIKSKLLGRLPSLPGVGKKSKGKKGKSKHDKKSKGKKGKSKHGKGKGKSKGKKGKSKRKDRDEE